MTVHITRPLAEMIQRGIIKIDKVKLAHEGGKHRITAGPYYEAVSNQKKKFAIFCDGRNVPLDRRRIVFTSSYDAARWLIAFCGAQRLRTELPNLNR